MRRPHSFLVRLSDVERQALDDLATAGRCSRADVLRRALRGDAATDTRRVPDRQAALELLAQQALTSASAAIALERALREPVAEPVASAPDEPHDELAGLRALRDQVAAGR